MAAMVVVGVIGLALAFTNPLFALVPVAAVLVIIVLFLVMGFHYADKYPQLAAMDGGQILRMHAQDAAMKPLPGAPPIDLEALPIINPIALEAPQTAEEADV